jgi:hypothetical protein
MAAAPNHRIRRLGRALTLLLVLGIGIGTGCESGAQRTIRIGPDGASEFGWPYWPTELRVHPLTRLVQEANGATVLEARVELLDAEGHTTKGIGLLILEVRTDEEGTVEERWERDLSDPTLNRLHYDEVTRTYLLRLAIDPKRLSGQPVLEAALVIPGQTTLEDRLRLQTGRLQDV